MLDGSGRTGTPQPRSMLCVPGWRRKLDLDHPCHLGQKHCQYGGKFLPQAAETLRNEGSPAVAPAQRKSPPLKKEEPAQASSAVESAASSSSVKEEAPAEISVKEEPAQAPIGLGLPPEPS